MTMAGASVAPCLDHRGAAMKTIISVSFLAAAMLAVSLGGPVLAQQDTTTQPNKLESQPVIPPGNPDNLNIGSDAPQPLTGELVPLPGPPPEGGAADLKLPDCKPPNCGVPQIMQ